MIPPRVVTFLTALLLALAAPRAAAALYLQIRSGPAGTVSLTVEGSGWITATQDDMLLFGTPGDTFLPNNAPQRYSGLNPAAPVPAMMLGGKPALNNFYRDDQGGFTGLHSIMGFYFGSVPLNGLLDLSSLNGVYTLPESRFSDFRIGTYQGLVTGTRPNMFQGLGEITLWVVPEPGTGWLTGAGLLLAARRRRRAA